MQKLRIGLIVTGLFMITLVLGGATNTTAEDIPEDRESRQIGYREAVILGIVEGITEYLPISSTGHLILTNAWLGIDGDEPMRNSDNEIVQMTDGVPITAKNAADAYAIIIQAGAILAVMVLYWPNIWQMILGVLGLNPTGKRLARNLVLAFLPAAVIGLLLNDLIESYLFSPIPIAIALAGGGLLMLGVERWRREQSIGQTMEVELHMLGVRQSLMIGFMQCIAMWPGTSRSMITIVGGYIVGLSPRKAAEFSFLLGLITLTAASAYKAVSTGPVLLQVTDGGPLLAGCFVAFLCAMVAIKWLISFLTRHGLSLFAWYRFVLAGLVLFFFL